MNRNVEALWVVEVFLSLLRVQRPTLPGCGLTPHTCRLPHTGLTASLQEHCGLAFPTSGLHDPLTPILYMFMLVFFNLNRRVRKGFQKQVTRYVPQMTWVTGWWTLQGPQVSSHSTKNDESPCCSQSVFLFTTLSHLQQNCVTVSGHTRPSSTRRHVLYQRCYSVKEKGIVHGWWVTWESQDRSSALWQPSPAAASAKTQASPHPHDKAARCPFMKDSHA